MIEVGFKSHVGLKRKNNEDAYLILLEDNVFMVADGVGGENAGEIASNETVQFVADYIKKIPLANCNNKEEIAQYFYDCLVEANSYIYKKSIENLENQGMATTLVIAYIKNEMLYVINVGDSRAYLIRNNNIVQITEDHTYINKLLKNGAIKWEDDIVKEKKHIITKAIGTYDFDIPDIFEIKIQEKDTLLLCTDGLHDDVTDEELVEKVVTSKDMNNLCGNLVEMANSKGGRDNITVICVKI